MSISRRKFLKLGLNGAFIITAGNALVPLGKDFIDLSSNKILCRFAIASDGHYGQPNTQYEKLHDRMIEWINAEKNDRGLDFTIINGDLFHNDVSFLAPVKEVWDKLAMPYTFPTATMTKRKRLIGRLCGIARGIFLLNIETLPLLF